MEKFLERFKLLVGEEAIEKLSNSCVIIFGIGGVGGYIAECMARSGVGHIDIVDKDKVDITNINRQIIATTKTIDKYKTDVMKERILEINPNCKVNSYQTFFLPETSGQFDFKKYDYVIDAIDNVKGKLELIEKAKREGAKIICAMGAGNRLDPSKFEISDIYKTSVCPLARVIRGQVKKRGIKKLKVAYSKETPLKTNSKTISSAPFCVASMGLLMAREVILDLINNTNN